MTSKTIPIGTSKNNALFAILKLTDSRYFLSLYQKQIAKLTTQIILNGTNSNKTSKIHSKQEYT